MKKNFRIFLGLLVILSLFSTILEILNKNFLNCAIFFAFFIVSFYLYIVFSRKFIKILNQIKIADEGSFTTDFPEKIKDEFDEATMNLSKLFKNLKVYDSLRAKDVTKSAKIFSILFSNTFQPCILIDLEQNTLLLNPQAQALFNLKTKEFPLDIIKKHVQNTDFSKFLDDIIEGKNEEKEIEIFFPSGIKKSVKITPHPVKTIEGAITTVILFLS